MTIYNSFLIGNNSVIVDEDGVRISNPIKAEEISLDWDTYYAIHSKVSDFYEQMENI